MRHNVNYVRLQNNSHTQRQTIRTKRIEKVPVFQKWSTTTNPITYECNAVKLIINVINVTTARKKHTHTHSILGLFFAFFCCLSIVLLFQRNLFSTKLTALFFLLRLPFVVCSIVCWFVCYRQLCESSSNTFLEWFGVAWLSSFGYSVA